jgi:hypothetical protein
MLVFAAPAAAAGFESAAHPDPQSAASKNTTYKRQIIDIQIASNAGRLASEAKAKK